MTGIGVALSSGGAATLAQAGVLEVLRGAGVAIEQVAGTSGGALVGAAFCAGRLDPMRDAMCALSRTGVLALLDPRWPRLGMLEGRRAMEFVRPFVGDTIESLPLPFAAVATDLDTAERVYLRQGDVVSAIRASIAVPGIFTPSVRDSRLLVDGALSDPIPVRGARALGASFVIAVNVLPLADAVFEWARPAAWDPLELASRAWASLMNDHPPQRSTPADADQEPLAPDERRGLFDVLLRASHVGQCYIAALSLHAAPADYVLTVPVPHVGLFEFDRAAELVELGREAARRELPALRRALRRALPLRQRLGRWRRRSG